MSALLPYFLRLSVSLAVVTMFYLVVLRRLTFYNWNRYFLLGYSLLSFFVAFIDISAVLQKEAWATSNLVQWIPVLNRAEIATGNTENHSFLTTGNIVGFLLITGMGIMFLRLLVQ